MPCGGTELKRLALVILAILAVVIVLKAQNATPQGAPPPGGPRARDQNPSRPIKRVSSLVNVLGPQVDVGDAAVSGRTTDISQRISYQGIPFPC
jgi:hypothetical protein